MSAGIGKSTIKEGNEYFKADTGNKFLTPKEIIRKMRYQLHPLHDGRCLLTSFPR
jgi:hypothetical protein